MDNNQNQPQPQAPQPMNPPQPASPQPMPNSAPQPLVQEVEQKGSNKGIWIILVIILLILIAVGVYLYKSSKSTAGVPQANQSAPSASPASTEAVSSLQKDLNSTSLDDLDKQFSAVDADISSL